MRETPELDRRAFLKGAGTAALLGAVGAPPLIAAEPTALGIPPSPPPQEFDFDAIYDRVGTNCSKWDGPIATYGDKIEVGMGIADMDFRAAPCIAEALAERSHHENWGYLRRPAEYAEAVADWNRRRYGLEIDPASLVFTTGVHPGLVAALLTFAPPGSRVLLTAPVYNGFYGDLRFTGTLPEDSPMKLVNGRYVIDFDDFERRASRANVFILCNPQNPTGNCWSAEDMTRLGEICLRHRVVVLADEIHCDFVTRGNHYTPFASLPNRDIVDNSLTFKSASKTFSIAGMKVAWYFSTNPDYLERVRAHTRADLSTLGMVASNAAITEGEPWFDQLLPYLDKNHDFAETYIRENLPLVKYAKAQGTYLAWLDVSQAIERLGAERTAEEISRTANNPVTPESVMQRWFVENAGVYLNPGHTYGTGGSGHMRMNLGTSRKLIERALGNMAEAMARI